MTRTPYLMKPFSTALFVSTRHGQPGCGRNLEAVDGSGLDESPNPIATFRRQVCQLCDRSEALYDHRHPLAATDTHGLQAEGPIPRLQVVDEGRHDAGAGHPERVAERDRAAV